MLWATLLALSRRPGVLSEHLSEEFGRARLLPRATVLGKIRSQQQWRHAFDPALHSNGNDVPNNIGVAVSGNRRQQVAVYDGVQVVSGEVTLDEAAGGEAATGMTHAGQGYTVVVPQIR
jgi:hypothetical protein